MIQMNKIKFIIKANSLKAKKRSSYNEQKKKNLAQINERKNLVKAEKILH